VVFCRFHALNMGDAVWHPFLPARNCDRHLTGDIAQVSFD